MLLLFAKAIVAGFAIAAPIGPMALLCIRRTIDFGWRAGFATGAGIAGGDTLLALVGALGLTGISSLMLEHERALRIASAPLLIYLGLRTLMDRTPPSDRVESFTSLYRACGSSALLTLANPPTLIAFAAVFTMIAPAGAPHFSTALATTVGIAVGSLLWWIVLITGIAFFRKSVTARLRRAISAFAGIALAAFGIAQLLSISLRG